ncbi:MAG: lysozyme inhibitor LprI family protein, partial [Thermaurantiacus sp.]
TWRALQPKLSQDARRQLLTEQRRWIAFREAACRFWAAPGFGSLHRSLAAPECVADIIAARTAQLRQIGTWLEEPGAN